MDTQFRPDNEVLARFAEAFERYGSMKKTHLHLVSRIRWSSFERYLSWLKYNNFVEIRANVSDEVYTLTPTGKEMFDTFLKFRCQIKSYKQWLFTTTVATTLTIILTDFVASTPFQNFF